MCSRKRSFDSEHNAINSRQFRETANVRAYHCPICNGWHLTSKETPPDYAENYGEKPQLGH